MVAPHLTVVVATTEQYPLSSLWKESLVLRVGPKRQRHPERKEFFDGPEILGNASRYVWSTRHPITAAGWQTKGDAQASMTGLEVVDRANQMLGLVHSRRLTGRDTATLHQQPVLPSFSGQTPCEPDGLRRSGAVRAQRGKFHCQEVSLPRMGVAVAQGCYDQSEFCECKTTVPAAPPTTRTVWKWRIEGNRGTHSFSIVESAR
jgi:hypothetical protein